jgi:ABC-type dipeptide/oligopeptide/nickel transport system permease subunit
LTQTASSADVTQAANPVSVVGTRSPWADSWIRLRRHHLAVASLVFLIVVVAVAILAPLITTASYSAIGFDPLAPASWQHIMGTDELGRDMWSRVAYGARISLIVGFGSQAIALAIGLPLGAVAGFYGGAADTTLMRATDIMFSLPSILVALLFVTAFGTTVQVLTFAIGFATWPTLARLVRAEVLRTKQLDFIEAAESIGCSRARILRVHVLPHTLGPVIVQVTFGVSQAIFTEAFLSFIGLGAQPPAPSWGRLLVDGFQYVRTSPHLVIFPGLALFLTILALNTLGDGLRDALDPHESD